MDGSEAICSRRFTPSLGRPECVGNEIFDKEILLPPHCRGSCHFRPSPGMGSILGVPLSQSRGLGPFSSLRSACIAAQPAHEEQIRNRIRAIFARFSCYNQEGVAHIQSKDNGEAISMHVLTETIIGMGVFGVFIGMLLESAYIPIPSEVILPYAGYLVYLGHASFLTAGLAGLGGSLLGAFISYEIAFYGGRPLVERYGRYIFIRRHELDKADLWFQRHGDAAVFIGRLLPGVRTFISLPAGVASMPIGRFLIFSLLGAIPWTVLFMAVGYELGRNWKHVSGQSHLFAAIAVLLLIVWLAILVYRRRQSHNTPRP